MKTLRLTGILVALMLVTLTFMPVAAAHLMETHYSRWTVPDSNIKLLSDDGKTAVYTMIYRFSEEDTRYYHIEKRREVSADGTENGTILVQTQDACGSDIRGSFGNESNYTKTQKRLWIHLTPEDMETVYSGVDGHLKFAGLFSVATNTSPGESVLFVDHIWPTTPMGHWVWTNADDSLDFYMSAESVARIPVAIKNSYCLWISGRFRGQYQDQLLFVRYPG